MGCGLKQKSLLGHPCLAPTLLYLTVAVFAQTQNLSLAASVGAEVGFRLRRNSIDDDLGQRRASRETGLTPFEETISASSSPAAAPGASVRDQIERELARAMVRSSEMANDTTSSRSSSRITRYYRLYNRCSSKLLRIAGRHVDTLAMPGDIYSELNVHTLSFDSQLTIQGSRSMNYLCFNKKGRLTIKHHSGHDRRCIFHEIHSSDHYTQFQSASNPHWMIGFGRRGQKLHGDWRSRPPKQHRCFQFVKTDFPYLGNDLNGRGGGAAGSHPQRLGPAGVPAPRPPLPRVNSEQQQNWQSAHHVVSKQKQRHASKT